MQAFDFRSDTVQKTLAMNDAMIDVAAPVVVQVVISVEAKTVHVNVNGVCAFRACLVPLILIDRDDCDPPLEELRC